jgi:hypothetical protein
LLAFNFLAVDSGAFAACQLVEMPSLSSAGVSFSLVPSLQQISAWDTRHMTPDLVVKAPKE